MILKYCDVIVPDWVNNVLYGTIFRIAKTKSPADSSAKGKRINQTYIASMYRQAPGKMEHEAN